MTCGTSKNAGKQVSMANSQSYEGVAVAVPVSLLLGRFSDVETPILFARALRELLTRSGIEKADIDGLAVSSFSLGPDPAIALARSLGLSLRWMEDVSLGGASGGVALNRAARAVQAGDASVVACIAADTNPKNGFHDLVANFSRATRDGVYPYGATGPTGPFALLTQQYMQASGTTRADFGALCVEQRHHAALVPHAVHNKPLSLDDYLNARMIAEPLGLYDCVMPVAGAEAFLVMSEEKAQVLDLPYANVLSGIEAHNSFGDQSSPLRGGWELGREHLYQQAGVGPDDVDIIETYDDYPVVSVLQLEELGFLPVGKGARVLAENDLLLKKHNTSGGQLSCGQAGAAGGFLGLVEALRQLTGQAGDWQYTKAKYALVSGYGMIVYDRCLATCATIMVAGGST